MRIKKENALAGVDMIIAVVVITIFSSLILALITNNALENLKTAKESKAIICLTEIFENIAIEEYNNITEDYIINNLIPKDTIADYEVKINIQDDFEKIEKYDPIIKKINIKLTYKIVDKEYECYMERLKVKE